MFDAHRHLEKHQKSDMPSMYCTSETLQWSTAIKLARHGMEGATYCLGYLPQHLASPLYGRTEEQDLQLYLRKFPTLQIGEVGLDKRYEQLVPLKRQAQELQQLLQLGKLMDRSVTLHVVQSDGMLLDLLREMGTDNLPQMLWHGFTSSAETARSFHSLGGTISLGPAIWRQGCRLQEHLHALWELPFTIETDKPGGWVPQQWGQLDHEALYMAHIRRLAQAMGIDEERLQEKTDAIGKILAHQQTAGR